MATIRTSKKKNPYTQIDNTPMRDRGLSLKAKGLICYLLSLPDNWEINVKDLEGRHKDGRDSINSAIKELMEAGYVSRKKSPLVNGKFKGYNYVVYEQPMVVHNGLTVTDKPQRINRNGKPATSNNTLSSKEDLVKTNSLRARVHEEQEKESKRIDAIKAERYKPEIEKRKEWLESEVWINPFKKVGFFDNNTNLQHTLARSLKDFFEHFITHDLNKNLTHSSVINSRARTLWAMSKGDYHDAQLIVDASITYKSFVMPDWKARQLQNKPKTA